MEKKIFAKATIEKKQMEYLGNIDKKIVKSHTHYMENQQRHGPME
jgi:hypothetical protein